MTQGLTFYKTVPGDILLSLQVHMKRPGCPTCDNTFISLSGYMHPFLFTRTASANAVTSFKVKDKADNDVLTLSTSLVQIRNAGTTDYIYCNFNPIAELACGLYYYEVVCGSEIYYSEMFNVIDNTLNFSTEDLVTNGDFTSDLSGWTADDATWSSGDARISPQGSISQVAGGESIVKITIDVGNDFPNDMQFIFGGSIYTIVAGVNVFFVPSGMTYTIKNNRTAVDENMFVESVTGFEIQSVNCYNLIVARNSCNKNNIPYPLTGYTDVFIFDAELYEPEYPRNDEVDSNGNKTNTSTFIRIDKRWTMQSSAQQGIYEPLVDELNKLPANNCIYIHNSTWNKVFKVFEGTLDIQTEQEWLFTDKCNAAVRLVITENMVLNDACCETIEGLDCCDSFEYEYEYDSISPDEGIVTITIPEGNCSLIYKLLTYDDGVLESTQIFTDSIQYNENGTDLITHELVGSRFGCPDIVYSNLS